MIQGIIPGDGPSGHLRLVSVCKDSSWRLAHGNASRRYHRLSASIEESQRKRKNDGLFHPYLRLDGTPGYSGQITACRPHLDRTATLLGTGDLAAQLPIRIVVRVALVPGRLPFLGQLLAAGRSAGPLPLANARVRVEPLATNRAGALLAGTRRLGHAGHVPGSLACISGRI